MNKYKHPWPFWIGLYLLAETSFCLFSCNRDLFSYRTFLLPSFTLYNILYLSLFNFIKKRILKNPHLLKIILSTMIVWIRLRHDQAHTLYKLPLMILATNCVRYKCFNRILTKDYLVSFALIINRGIRWVFLGVIWKSSINLGEHIQFYWFCGSDV